MTRRPLTEGIKGTSPVDAQLERDFVFQNKRPAAPLAPAMPTPPPSSSPTISRVPISTRNRSDYAGALKRASLARQIEGVFPNTLQDMLEQALEPWLKANGYFD